MTYTQGRAPSKAQRRSRPAGGRAGSPTRVSRARDLLGPRRAGEAHKLTEQEGERFWPLIPDNLQRHKDVDSKKPDPRQTSLERLRVSENRKRGGVTWALQHNSNRQMTGKRDSAHSRSFRPCHRISGDIGIERRTVDLRSYSQNLSAEPPTGTDTEKGRSAEYWGCE